MARMASSVALLVQPELGRTSADVPKMFPFSNFVPNPVRPPELCPVKDVGR